LILTHINPKPNFGLNTNRKLNLSLCTHTCYN